MYIETVLKKCIDRQIQLHSILLMLIVLVNLFVYENGGKRGGGGSEDFTIFNNISLLNFKQC